MEAVRTTVQTAIKVFVAAALAVGLLPALAMADDRPDQEIAAVEETEGSEAAERTDSPDGANGESAPGSETGQGSDSEGESGSDGEEAGTTANPEDWEFSANADGTATLIDYRGLDADVVVPDVIDGRSVTAIDLDDPAALTGIRSIELPASVERIGGGAFEGMANLAEVTLPQNSHLEAIGEEAFAGTGITSFAMPAILTSIGAAAFANCPNLETIAFNDMLDPLVRTRTASDGAERVTYQEAYAIATGSPATFVVPASSENFQATADGALLSKDGTILYERSAAATSGSFAVPNSVREIAANAFAGQTELAGIILPDGLATIGERAFAESGIRSIDIPDSVTTVRAEICADCVDLRSVVIGTGVVELGAAGAGGCFSGCSELASVALGTSLRTIDDACFAETGITSINVPASVREIGYGAFGDNPQLSSVSGCEGLKTIEMFAFRNANISTFPFGDELDFVSGAAFEGCASFASAYPAYLARNESGDWVRGAATASTVRLSIDGEELYSYAYDVLGIVNEQRIAQGMLPLTMDANLLDAAMQRAAEVAINFSHTRPGGTSCFTVSSKAQGENIAAGPISPNAAMSVWMNSTGHRDNILNPSWKSVGIGCFRTTDGSLYWVQLFGSANALASAEPADRDAMRTLEVSPSVCPIRFEIETETTAYQGDWACMEAGDADEITVRATNTGFADVIVNASSFAWTSSNENAATVSAGGVVRGEGDGAATIVGTWGDERVVARVLVGCEPNAQFSDVDGHWGEGWIMTADALDIMHGYSDPATGIPTGTFGTEDNVSRAMLATILYRHANPDSTATTDPAAYEKNETEIMTDVPDGMYYTAAINWAVDEGIMTGDVDQETGEQLGTVRPDDPIARQDAATMIARYAALYGIDATGDPAVYADAPDAAEVGAWASESLAWCFENGIITGWAGTGELDAFEPASRAAIAKIAVAAIETIEAELA